MPRTPQANRKRSFKVLELVAHQAVEDVRKFWREHQRYPTVLLAWPLNPKVRYDVVHCSIPSDASLIRTAMELTAKTDAYALFLLEQQEHRVRLLLETQEQALAIYIPIERHGDTKALGKEREERNTESLGVLWKAGRPSN